MDFIARRKKLTEHMNEQDYTLALLTDPSTIYYYTGYHGALGIDWGRPNLFVLMNDGDSYLITPSMEEEMANTQTDVTEVIPWTDGLDDEWRKPLSGILENIKIDRMGIDYLKAPRVVLDFVMQYVNPNKINDIGMVIESMRMVKDQYEIQIARHTGEVAIAMLEGAMEAAAPGVYEFEVSLAAEKAGTYKAAELMRKYYKEEEPFNYPTISNQQQIMASGRLTTMCHHRAGMTKLEHGEPLFICHCGTVSFKGFYLGFDRTLFVGEINEEVSRLLKIAESAQKAALAEIKPGAVAEDAFFAYAEVIQTAGYPIPFRAGRSLGFSVNGFPQLANGDKTILEEGMIFAVDGGADAEDYRTQVGDSILVTKDGYEFITPFTKNHKDLIVG
ncbi:Xaa-Pro peptidase family protein [Sporosarcina sp. P3]|uniref:M24 family metallopeptidase n=1 Tax=Sporosarcina sp. P3 TaxID=2048245 RepID=UPI001E38120A|nr:Xaa-Pro peptidase family protein [Sporosarcina sp. P3]